MRMIRLIACIACVALAWPTWAATASTIEGVSFASTQRVGDTTLHLSCTGLLRYMTFLKGYVAGLYLADGARPDDVLSDVPKRLEISYFWSIKGSDFGPAGDKILAENVAAETVVGLRPRLDRINALYRDVKPGDRYALTYVPGRGTELSLNDQPLGTIEGADFAAAYFSIWLGKNPLDASLKSQLLSCPKA